MSHPVNVIAPTSNILPELCLRIEVWGRGAGESSANTMTEALLKEEFRTFSVKLQIQQLPIIFISSGKMFDKAVTLQLRTFGATHYHICSKLNGAVPIAEQTR